MRLAITSQSHNRVDWVVRTKILWIELGLTIFTALSSILIASTTNPLRWRVIFSLIGIGAMIAIVLAATTPISERGTLERLPDGGQLMQYKLWIPVGRRKVLEIPVEEIDGFRYEETTFQDSDEDRYRMARLWVIRKSEQELKLTLWLDPEAVYALGDALTKACRCDYLIDEQPGDL